METRYLNIDARCVTVFDQLEEQASGGGRVYCTRLPRRREHPSPAPSGRKVLDLEEYRRQHFGGAQEPLRPEETPLHREAHAPSSPSRGERLGMLLDLCATGAIVCLTVGALIGFLG